MGDQKSHDLGRLLRIKEAASAAGGGQASHEQAAALLDSYKRLRAQTAEVIGEDSERVEFEAMFPELEASLPPSPGEGGDPVEWHYAATTAAAQAGTLLRQLSGWVQGLIVEQTLPARIEAEAAEKVKQEKRGFEGI